LLNSIQPNHKDQNCLMDTAGGSFIIVHPSFTFFSFFSARSSTQDSLSITTWKCSLIPSFKIHHSDNQLTSSSGHARVQKVQRPTKTASFGYFPVLPESDFLKLYKFQVYDQRLIFYPCERVARSPWNLASTER